jgi:hypothetical protein
VLLGKVKINLTIVQLFHLFGTDGSLVGCLKGLLVQPITFLLPFLEQRQVYPLFFAHLRNRFVFQKVPA